MSKLIWMRQNKARRYLNAPRLEKQPRPEACVLSALGGAKIHWNNFTTF